VYKKLVKDGLSVRQTEALVRDMKNPSQTIKKAPATVEHPEVKKNQRPLKLCAWQ